MSLLKKLLGWTGPPSSRHRAPAPRPAIGDAFMTLDDLIDEGRRLQRECVFLKPSGTGEPVATWHDREARVADARGLTPWLSVDTRRVPGIAPDAPRFVTLFTDEESAGAVEAVQRLPPGVPLYAHPADVLPPIEAVFAFGSDRVAAWLEAQGWDRSGPCGRDDALVEAYRQAWFDEYPIYGSDPDVVAMLGGWSMPWPDDDWDDRLPERLLALTLRDSEPWVEAWQHPSGALHVIQRIT